MERRPKVKRNNNNNNKRTHKLKSKDHVVQLGFFLCVWFARVACSTVVTLCAADSSFVQLPARESCCKEKKKKNSRRKKKKDM